MIVRLNPAGIEEVLNSSEVNAALDEYALTIGVAVEGSPEVSRNGVPVDVDEYVAQGGRLKGTRSARAVTMIHPAGLPIEAKYGTLVREGGAAGLEVHAR